jgi:regulator of replication initiation timing
MTMGYILIVTIVLWIITLMAMWDMRYKIKDLSRDLFDCDNRFMKLLRENEKLTKEINDLKSKPQAAPTTQASTDPIEMMMEEMLKKSEQENLQELIDLRKAWRWNGKKGVEVSDE